VRDEDRSSQAAHLFRRGADVLSPERFVARLVPVEIRNGDNAAASRQLVRDG